MAVSQFTWPPIRPSKVQGTSAIYWDNKVGWSFEDPVGPNKKNFKNYS